MSAQCKKNGVCAVQALTVKKIKSPRTPPDSTHPSRVLWFECILDTIPMTVVPPTGSLETRSTPSVVASLLRPDCPWIADDELGVKDVSQDTDASVSREEAEDGMRELARRVTGGEPLATFSGGHHDAREKTGERKKETRVSELVSIIEVIDEDGTWVDAEADADGGGGDETLLEPQDKPEAAPSVHDLVLLIALYSIYMPASDAPCGLLDAVCSMTRQSTEELVSAVLPAALNQLHDVIVAHVEFEQAQVSSATLESYSGPSAWDRCLCCMQLTWMVKHMRGDMLDERELMVLLHALALGSKDVSYQVRNQSLECVEAFIGILGRWTEGQASYSRAIADVIKESVSANDDRCWTASYRCAGHLMQTLGSGRVKVKQDTSPENDAHCLEGAQKRILDDLFECVMGMARRNQHSLAFASVWLDAIGVEMRVLGVELMHYRPLLLPMLVDWAKALHTEIRLGALRCVLVYLQQCWPRNRAIGRMIQEDLEEIGDIGSSDAACQALLEEIRAVLAATGGQP